MSSPRTANLPSTRPKTHFFPVPAHSDRVDQPRFSPAHSLGQRMPYDSRWAPPLNRYASSQSGTKCWASSGILNFWPTNPSRCVRRPDHTHSRIPTFRFIPNTDFHQITTSLDVREGHSLPMAQHPHETVDVRPRIDGFHSGLGCVGY